MKNITDAHHENVLSMSNGTQYQHSTTEGSAQLGNSLVHVHVQVVHKFGYCQYTTWEMNSISQDSIQV